MERRGDEIGKGRGEKERGIGKRRGEEEMG